MDTSRFSKLILPFSVLVISVLIVFGGMFFLSKNPASSPTPAPQSQEATFALLNNLEYFHSYCGVPMKLTDGVFQWTDEYTCTKEKSFGFLFQVYNEKIAIGDLDSDGKNDAAVILTTNYGGSGNFRELAAVINQNNEPKHITSVDLGDRIVVHNVSIQNSRVILDMIVHGSEDGACCPTQPIQKTFQFNVQQQKLIEI